jgi:hypothetical protein
LKVLTACLIGASAVFGPRVNAVKIPAATKFRALLDECRPSAVIIRNRETRRNTKMLANIEAAKQSNGEGNNTDAGLWRSYLEDLLRSPEAQGTPNPTSTKLVAEVMKLILAVVGLWLNCLLDEA